MKVVSLGAGNVATHLITELYKHSFEILQVYSRTIESSEVLANKVNAAAVTDLKNISKDADIYLFTLKDSVLEGVAAQLIGREGLWIHTAGSVSMEIFSNYTTHYGVLYPFQTFSKNREVKWKGIPLFIEGSDANSFNKIEEIGKLLSDKVLELNSEERKYIHLTGVFACNFTNHMYTLSKMILKRVNLPFEITLPLIDETAQKVHSLSPEDAQTGPAVRYDTNIINKHLSLIEEKNIKEIYRLISENINKIENER